MEGLHARAEHCLALEQERSQIAHELHDEIGQGLFALALGLSALSENLSDTTQKQRVGDLISNTSSLLDSVRRMHRGLRAAPPLGRDVR